MNTDSPQTPASYADFSQPEQGGWLRTVVQFFAIPLLIVCVAVGLYLGITLMVGAGPSTAADFVELLQSDTINRRWQAAAELASRLRAAPEVPAEFRDPRLVRALATALESARAEREDPPRLAVMVLAILHRLGDPASVDSVRAALDDEHPWVRAHAIRALAGLGDRASIPRVKEFTRHDDPQTRRAALYVLTQLEQVEGLPFRLTPDAREIALEHLGDRHEDVRFTAALILADAGEKDAALPVLAHMLDRAYLGQFDLDARLSGISQYDLHSNVIREAMRRVVRLGCGDRPEVVTALRRLADQENEGDPEIRRQARDALAALSVRENG